MFREMIFCCRGRCRCRWCELSVLVLFVSGFKTPQKLVSLCALFTLLYHGDRITNTKSTFLHIVFGGAWEEREKKKKQLAHKMLFIKGAKKLCKVRNSCHMRIHTFLPWNRQKKMEFRKKGIKIRTRLVSKWPKGMSEMKSNDEDEASVVKR